jgi:quercetin dioxygenase-like cupin family protein
MTLLIALLLAAATPPSTEEVLVAKMKDAKYAPNTAKGVPPGVSGSPIGVDPTTKGGTGFGKFAPGTKFPEHMHSFAEYSMLMAGKVTLTIADKTYELEPGDYAIIPAKTPHSLVCHEGAECIQFTRRAGPIDYTFTGK